jgi:nitrate reductase gamma subunit
MFQKLFHASLVVFLVMVSIAVLAVVISVVMSMIAPQMLAESAGISAGSGGVTTKQLGLMIVAGSLIIAGFYLYARRGRFRR